MEMGIAQILSTVVCKRLIDDWFGYKPNALTNNNPDHWPYMRHSDAIG